MNDKYLAQTQDNSKLHQDLKQRAIALSTSRLFKGSISNKTPPKSPESNSEMKVMLTNQDYVISSIEK